MTKKELSELAEMIQRGFAEAASNLAALQTEMEAGFEKVDSKFSEITDRLDRVVLPELDSHAHRIKTLEERALH